MAKMHVFFVVLSTCFVGFSVAEILQFRNTSSRQEWYTRSRPATRQVASCPGGHCHSRNCCSFYCLVGESCLMITGKPFCVDVAGQPYDAPHCVETRCLDCPISSGLYCSTTMCADLEAYPSMVMCDFSSIRGPVRS
ncbi:uncharacterized protein LOC110855438 isoform X2 [Folsomia candida]|uniref:uncharacterized protein LOC110855438 isoform X2 n=1 Tax=Folsomia candida TaxID=158441 RepID=UPI000B901480|nr:uncharacterized protein LOC110855438 isoform X2 [Folsomia candida]